MRFINENMIDLSAAEAEAARDASSQHNRIAIDVGADARAAARNAAGTFDLTPGIKLASLLHEGKLHAAVLAGSLAEITGRIVEYGTSVINTGDIERGRSLALRNFEHDPELITDEIERVPGLDKIVNAYIEIKNAGQAVEPEPVSAGTAKAMTDEDLALWRKMAIDSLVAIEFELASRGQLKDDNGSVERAFGGAQSVANRAYSEASSSLSRLAAAQIPRVGRKPRKTAKRRRK